MEDTGRVDDEGRAVFERVDLMEAFVENVPVTKQKYMHRALVYSMYVRAKDANDMDVSCAEFQPFCSGEMRHQFC